MKTNIDTPISEFLKHFIYNPDTGELTWRIDKRPAKSGDYAGTVNHDGYRKVMLFKKYYSVHRVAWAMTYGDWPIGEVDHIDGDRLNNRLENLRDTTHRGNSQNRQAHRKGHLVGTTRVKHGWQSSITINYKRMHLGIFASEQEAHSAYLKAQEAIA